MRKDNIFKDGGIVEGESLIGYKEIYKKLQRDILVNRGNLACVGPYRMGKTSLLLKLYNEAKKNYSKIVPAFINVKECVPYEDKTPFDSFLIDIVKKIESGLSQRLNLNNCKDFRNEIAEFKNSSGGTTFRNSFKRIFTHIKNLGMHTLLILDEFDSAEKIFESTADFELFRTLADPNYAVSLVFVSRRRLHMIEKKNENNSTFHNAFRENHITGFSAEDAELVFETLQKNYDICLSNEQKERIRYYAGRSPFIYSAFCRELVEQKIAGRISFDPDEIYKKNILATVIDYSKVLYSRLHKDGHLSKLTGILFGPTINITPSDKDMLFFMGYLSEDTLKGEYYQALSGYFTDYLHNKYYFDDSWKNIMAVHNLMKDLILKSFRPLTEKEWQDLMENAYLKLFGVSQNFDYKHYEGYINNNLKIFDTKSTLLEVLSLRDVFIVIQCYWEDNFRKYFDNKSYATFEEHFKLCARARNPLAHGLEKYLTKLENEKVNVYCEEILAIVNKNLQDLKLSADFNPLVGVIKKVPATPKNNLPKNPEEKNLKIDASNIGKEGMLTDIQPNKNRGIKGIIFGVKGTVEKSLLKHKPEDYKGQNLIAKVKRLNPQGTSYILELIDDIDKKIFQFKN